jgi:hypothetical protein
MLPEARSCGALALVLALPSCTVPEVSFASEDAAVHDAAVDAVAGESARTGAPGETNDAAEKPPGEAGAQPMLDAEADVAVDASASGCPVNASFCCPGVPCYVPNSDTKKCKDACTACEQKCGHGGLTCCLSANGTPSMCVSSPAACPQQ